jgi:orotidine-5'-phosphate decarboxylase
MMPKAMHNPIIVALDVESAAAARALVARIGPRVNFYKVGLELYTAAGMEMVKHLLAEGKQVFLDLKMYDIPETVARAVDLVALSGVRFLTVHAVSSVMRAAVAARTVASLVERRARKAVEVGVDGIVASPLEAAAVRRIVGLNTLIVTPGVRSPGVDAGDQKRVATPAQAIRDGADYLVIGRQITRAADPAVEVDRILMELVTPT